MPGCAGTIEPDIGDTEYWEAYYEEELADVDDRTGADAVFDWFFGWTEVRPIIEPLTGLGLDGEVLHLGCGNSALPEEMLDFGGYRRQTCVDICRSVVQHMEARNSLRPGLRWIAADCTDLTTVLPSDGFGLVIDKGAMDVFLARDEHALAVASFIKEAFRLTSPGGYYVSINLASPERVLCWLRHKAFAWKVEVVPVSLKVVSADKECRAYVCSKQAVCEDSLCGWPALLERVRARPDSDLSSSESEEEDDADDYEEGEEEEQGEDGKAIEKLECP
mmetsp:Transcript_18480/g.41815  ORF Transcript_18480/g.41815 Transcript_18480/m.41815 type:complete len:277 (-) Transcript_18480:55-885(-)